jgi:hypothetical protein
MESKPSDQSKKAGLDSLAELAALSTCSQRTLINWHKNKPVLFECVLRGAVAKKHDA